MGALGRPEYEEVDLTVDVENMLGLMAQSLYPRADAAIRELLANAVDALRIKEDLKLKRLEILDPDTPPKVTVSYDPMQRLLRVQDTGCGMTDQEIRQYVNQIGVSGTRAHAEADRTLLKELIGQFGIGLLACFKLGENLRIETRSVRQLDDPLGVEWINEGGGKRAKMRRCVVPFTGTRVSVTVKYEHHKLLQDRLSQLIRSYGDLLPYPIYDGLGNLANSYNDVPWETGRAADREALKEYLVRRAKPEPINPPLWVIPIAPTKELTMRGVIYVPDDRRFTNTDGRLDLYVKRMLVRKDLPGVLPEHLMFCHGVVDCADLTIIMSREDVMRDSVFDRFRDELRRQILEGLRDLASRPKDFSEVQWRFDPEIKAGVLASQDLFDVLADSLYFWAGSRERMTLRAYCEEAGGRPDVKRRRHIYYIASGGSSQARYQVDQMLQRKGLRALEIVELPSEPSAEKRTLEPPRSLDRSVLEAYAQRRGMQLLPASEAVEAFPDTEDPSWQLVKDIFTSVMPRSLEIQVRVSAFEPEHLPALLRAADVTTLLDRLRQVQQAAARFQAEHPDAAGDLDTIFRAAEEHARTQAATMQLILNCNHPVLRNLRDTLAHPSYRAYDPEYSYAKTVAAELYHLALQYSGHQVDEVNMHIMVRWRCELVEAFLKHFNIVLAQVSVPPQAH